jgi:hypothetical protein
MSSADLIASEVAALEDPRLSVKRVVRRGDWGQAEKFEAALDASSEYVGFPNDDAYYCPRYLELMVIAAEHGHADLVYCDWVSDRNLGRPYAPFTVAPRVGHVDVGGFLVRRSVLLEDGWTDRGPIGDGLLVERLVAKGVRHVRVPATLFVKN